MLYVSLLLPTCSLAVRGLKLESLSCLVVNMTQQILQCPWTTSIQGFFADVFVTGMYAVSAIQNNQKDLQRLTGKHFLEKGV